MNRDVYSIILGKANKVLEVNLLNAHNKWERAYIHDDVVKGFMCCKCLMLCTKNCHPDTNKHQHMIVDSWERLIDIHHPDNLYRVTPITASGINAFLTTMAICSCPGSPFILDHRADHVPYRCALTYKSPVRAAVEKFFKEEQRKGKFPATVSLDSGHLPIQGIEFDAILKAPKDCGLVVVKPTINPVAITHMANMVRFIDSPFLFDNTGLDRVPWNEVSKDSKKRHLFLAGETTMPQQLEKQMIEQARQHGIHLFHKKGLQFTYCG